MALQIFINGKYYDKENAKISVYDHGLLYGDGVFEGLRSYSGKVFRMQQHLDRSHRHPLGGLTSRTSALHVARSSRAHPTSAKGCFRGEGFYTKPRVYFKSNNPA